MALLPNPGRLLRAAFIIFLSACGGNDNTAAANTAATLLPTVFTSEGRALNSCGFHPVCSGNPHAPFFANVSLAPTDGATLSGIVRLEVSGNEMANVELLPAMSYAPKLGIFNISADKTRAWLDLDTTTMPNGSVHVRISAFNVPAGQAGVEIITMPARIWNISNAGLPPAPFTAALTAAPVNGAVVNGITRLEVRGSGMANVELLPASGYMPKLGVFNVSTDRTLAWLDFDSRSLPDGIQDVKISAFNVTEGQPGAVEIVVMPSRRWELRNGVGFTASVTMAPLHGAMVSGVARLEVRGSGMENVELLPVEGYSPKYGKFIISADKTFAWLDWDSRILEGGPLPTRISAFNKPAGSSDAREIIAMPVREWTMNNLGQCTYVTRNLTPDGFPAASDGRPVGKLFCFPIFWDGGLSNEGFHRECKCHEPPSG